MGTEIVQPMGKGRIPSGAQLFLWLMGILEVNNHGDIVHWICMLPG